MVTYGIAYICAHTYALCMLCAAASWLRNRHLEGSIQTDLRITTNTVFMPVYTYLTRRVSLEAECFKAFISMHNLHTILLKVKLQNASTSFTEVISYSLSTPINPQSQEK